MCVCVCVCGGTVKVALCTFFSGQVFAEKNIKELHFVKFVFLHFCQFVLHFYLGSFLVD